jgi:hypothetical protein
MISGMNLITVGQIIGALPAHHFGPGDETSVSPIQIADPFCSLLNCIIICPSVKDRILLQTRKGLEYAMFSRGLYLTPHREHPSIY